MNFSAFMFQPNYGKTDLKFFFYLRLRHKIVPPFCRKAAMLKNKPRKTTGLFDCYEKPYNSISIGDKLTM
jgi:hypothetical protein